MTLRSPEKVLVSEMRYLYNPLSPDALLRKIRETLDGPSDQAKA